MYTQSSTVYGHIEELQFFGVFCVLVSINVHLRLFGCFTQLNNEAEKTLLLISVTFNIILCLIIEFKLLAINIGAMLFPSQVPDLNIQVRNLTITEITSVTSVKAFPLLPLCSRCNTPFTQQRALHRLL